MIAVGLLILSGFAGWARGGVREMVSLVSFTLALLIAAYALPFTGPVLRRVVHPAWAGSAAAVVVAFVLAYMVIRVTGDAIAKSLAKSTALGVLDRMIGLAFGVVRALVFMGVFALLFDTVTPRDLRPAWIVTAKTYPLARGAASVLKLAAPKAMTLTHGVTDDITRRVKKGVFGADSEPQGSGLTDPFPSPSIANPEEGLDNGAPPHRRTKPKASIRDQEISP